MNENKMNRGLKNRHLQLISLGGVIGSGYFLGTGYVLEKAGPAAILAYLLGGVIVLCVMLCLAELAVEKPVSGSFVTYAKENISATWACGVGWAYWITWVAYVPSEMIAAGIIMSNFVPAISQLWWAVLFGLLVTVINLFHVDKFGESEFWLALFKIIALVAFSIVAGLICLGLIGDEGYIGTSVLLGSGGFAPNGYWSIILTMVIILVNFQGTEIIGLAAGECKNPEKSIPIAVRNVTWRIIALYIIPISLLISILPWDQAGLDESVFAAALAKYGMTGLSSFFAFVILTAAISCSNSGLYGAARAMYSLARMDMAPRFLGEINKNGMPSKAILLSICACWAVILLYSIDPDSAVYTYLLADLLEPVSSSQDDDGDGGRQEAEVPHAAVPIRDAVRHLGAGLLSRRHVLHARPAGGALRRSADAHPADVLVQAPCPPPQGRRGENGTLTTLFSPPQ